MSTPFEPDELGDAIPVDLDALEVWQVGDQLLREVLAGRRPGRGDDRRAARAARCRRASSDATPCEDVTEECQQLWTRTAELRDGRARVRSTSTSTSATAAGSPAPSPASTATGSSRSATPGSRPSSGSQSWVDLLALSAVRPDEQLDRPRRRPRAGQAAQRALAGPLDHRAADWLRDLVELRDLGLTRPLPVPVTTAAAWAEAHARELIGQDVARSAPPDASGRPTRTTPSASTGEDADAYHLRVFGDARAARGAGRRRAGRLRLADLGAAADRRREGGRRCDRPRSPSTSRGRCPTGTTLLEASAGTGKTWTIGALVTRYVAEGHARLEEMLVVTFGRAASQELRERVRAQLVEAERVLSDDPAARAGRRRASAVRPGALLHGWDDEPRRAAATGG